MTTLTRHGVPKNERDVYRDIVTKLDYGSLFAWLGGRGFISHRNITEHMFPFTFDILRPGTVYGKQRIVTKKSGNYGWDNDKKALHIVYLYDQRGAPVRSNFVTTVDNAGARTELELQYEQSAVIVKLPVTLATSSPVNINVRQYDPQMICLALNGKGRARVNVSCGEFPVDADGKYQLIVDGKSSVIKPQNGQLSFEVELDGQANVEIRTTG